MDSLGGKAICEKNQCNLYNLWFPLSKLFCIKHFYALNTGPWT